MKRRNTAAFAAAFLIISLFSGCHFGKSPASSEETSSSADYPVKVCGVELSKSPSDVIVLSPSLAEIVTDMGYGDAICGRSEECDVPSAVAALPSVGSMLLPDIDKLCKLNPDCVLTQNELPQSLKTKLNGANISVIVVPAAETFDDLAETYETVGKIFSGGLSGPHKGKAQLTALTDALDVVTEKVSAASVKQPLNVVYVTDTFGHVATGDTVMGRILTAAGGVNAAESATKWTATNEQLTDVDVIFCPDTLVSKVKAMSQFVSTPAVTGDRVYGISAADMERQSLSMADAAESMARDLYPDAWKS